MDFLSGFQIVHEKEIQAEDDQVFLVKLQVRGSVFNWLFGSWCVCWLLIGEFLCPHSQSLLAKQPTVTPGRPVVSCSLSFVSLICV